MVNQIRVCMFVYNNCKRDARVLKEAKTLAQAGYDVQIIAVLDKETEPYEERDGFRIIRVVKDPLHYRILRGIREAEFGNVVKGAGKGVLRLVLLPFKIVLALIWLLVRGPVQWLSLQTVHLKHKFIGRQIDTESPKIKSGARFGEVLRRIDWHVPSFVTTVLYYLKAGYYWGIRRPLRVLWYRYIKRGYYWGIRRPLRVLWYRYIKRGYYWGIRRPLRILWYRYIRRGYYWGVRRPLRVLWYRYIKKGYYWGVRRPLRILWYRYIKKGYYWGVRRPLRILWYRYIKKGYYWGVRRPLRILWYRYIKKGYYWGVRRPLRILWYRYIKKGYYWGIRRPLRILWYRYIKKGYYLGVRRPLRILWYRHVYRGVKSFLMLLHRPLSFLDFYVRSMAYLKQEQCDVYHAHDFNTLPVALWAQHRFGGRVVYDSHELYTETSNISKLEKAIVGFLERVFVRRVHAVITVNNSIAQELMHRYNMEPPVIVMNCPPRKRFVERQNSEEAVSLIPKALGLSQEVQVVLYQGGFSPNRGLENLVLAAQYLDKRRIVVFMGWGRLESVLKGMVKELGLESKVYFHPPVSQEDLLLYTSSAHIGVIPYQFVGLNNYYSTPNKLFEYMMAGLPIVSSDFPELKRIIEGYNLGKTFDPDDPKDIARAINEVFEDETQYEQMRRNALKAAEIYNWENESKKLLALYQRLEESLAGGRS